MTDAPDGHVAVSDAPHPAGRQEWWRHGYGRFLTAHGLSALGDRASMIIVPFCLLAVGVSAGGVAAVLGARAVGYALMVLYGGTLGDRLDRRHLMIASDLVRFGTQSALVVLVLSNGQGVAVFLVLQFVYGLAEGLFRPAASGVIPALVPDARLERANGLLSGVVNGGMVLGPVLGGLFVQAGLAALGLGVDAFTFLLSALLLRGLPEMPRTSRPRRRFIADLVEGWQVIAARGWLLMLIVTSSLFHLISLSAVFSLGPAWADQALGGAQAWGTLVTAFGVGGIVGGFAAIRFAPTRPGVVCILLLTVLSAQPLFLSSGAPLAVIAFLQLLAGLSLSLYASTFTTTYQRFTPDDAVSRVSAFDSLASTALLPLGYLLVGWLADLMGIAAAMRVVAAVGILVCLAGLLSKSLRALRHGSAAASV
ncbi:MFS transporter [Nonomuraea sp. NPDC049758]|uniref:MFS transporter n=1 Tax=Nonomuraea sp. NPDC049758 TaxID=3154360 RepID=UPI0034274B8A